MIDRRKLYQLLHEGTYNVTELSHLLNVSVAATSKAIKKLREEDHAQLSTITYDKRKEECGNTKIYTLTQKGRLYHQHLNQQTGETQQRDKFNLLSTSSHGDTAQGRPATLPMAAFSLPYTLDGHAYRFKFNIRCRGKLPEEAGDGYWMKKGKEKHGWKRFDFRLSGCRVQINKNTVILTPLKNSKSKCGTDELDQDQLETVNACWKMLLRYGWGLEPVSYSGRYGIEGLLPPYVPSQSGEYVDVDRTPPSSSGRPVMHFKGQNAKGDTDKAFEALMWIHENFDCLLTEDELESILDEIRDIVRDAIADEMQQHVPSQPYESRKPDEKRDVV